MAQSRNLTKRVIRLQENPEYYDLPTIQKAQNAEKHSKKKSAKKSSKNKRS